MGRLRPFDQPADNATGHFVMAGRGRIAASANRPFGAGFPAVMRARLQRRPRAGSLQHG